MQHHDKSCIDSLNLFIQDLIIKAAYLCPSLQTFNNEK